MLPKFDHIAFANVSVELQAGVDKAVCAITASGGHEQVNMKVDGQLPFSLLEADIETLLTHLATGRMTCVELAARYLARIGAFDRAGVRLNAVPVLNPDVFAEAADSDRRHRAGTARPLEGIPFTVKDSYMVRGMTVAAGSPAFAHLIAQHDAFSVACLRAAGAVLIGKTNMPPMADGGMQRGVYGRAESPYNPHYLAAAYASGSSHGSGVATAANLAVFGMGEETVSSGRSPASNNGLCAYTPSWGVLSIRGNWPLFPARDVVVPHTRSMPDMLRLLDVLVQDDPLTRGDFWRHQQSVPIPRPSVHRPLSYANLHNAQVLHGKRLGVPAMYLGKDADYPLDVRPSVLALWARARARLEALGAEVVEVDFPLIKQYEGRQPGGEDLERLGILPHGWLEAEFTHFMAHGWEDFLRANGAPTLSSLAAVDPECIFPRPPGALPDRDEAFEQNADRYRVNVEAARDGLRDPRERPDYAQGLQALVRLREQLFENWLGEQGLDAVVFPANADVGAHDSDIDARSADYAWQNGVLFSNGNYALRHLGIPTVTVAMGRMDDTGMPVGLTFAGAAYTDPTLLAYATAFEQHGTLRPLPTFAPALPEDEWTPRPRHKRERAAAQPTLTLQAELDPGHYHEGAQLLWLSGTCEVETAVLEVTVNGRALAVHVQHGQWHAHTVLPAVVEPPAIGGNPRPCRALVVALARSAVGDAAAFISV